MNVKKYKINNKMETACTPENYDIELYCPVCKESCMYSFDSENENFYAKNSNRKD